MYPVAGCAIDRLLHAADTALYRVKDSGRNLGRHLPRLRIAFDDRRCAPTATGAKAHRGCIHRGQPGEAH